MTPSAVLISCFLGERPGQVLLYNWTHSFNCRDTEENGTVGATDSVNVTSDGSIAVLLCNLLTPQLTWPPPIEQFILAVKLTLSLHHRLYRFTAAAASPLQSALQHAHVESVPSRLRAAGSIGLNPHFSTAYTPILSPFVKACKCRRIKPLTTWK